MFIEKIAPRTPKGNYNVIIEIAMHDNGFVKYEFDKDIGMLRVDRFMQTTMSYPCNYGFIPGTLSEDGDPIDVLVMSRAPLVPGVLIEVRPVAVLIMEDESGKDEKIIAVPAEKLDISFDKVQDIADLDSLFKDKIVHFFENYKKLDKDKWVKIEAWEGAAKAKEFIETAIAAKSVVTENMVPGV